jgi:hypothetical protein
VVKEHCTLFVWSNIIASWTNESCFYFSNKYHHSNSLLWIGLVFPYQKNTNNLSRANTFGNSQARRVWSQSLWLTHPMCIIVLFDHIICFHLQSDFFLLMDRSITSLVFFFLLFYFLSFFYFPYLSLRELEVIIVTRVLLYSSNTLNLTMWDSFSPFFK